MKPIFLLLFVGILSIGNLSAQVRIGNNTPCTYGYEVETFDASCTYQTIYTGAIGPCSSVVISTTDPNYRLRITASGTWSGWVGTCSASTTCINTGNCSGTSATIYLSPLSGNNNLINDNGCSGPSSCF